jgi:hypothetical protein
VQPQRELSGVLFKNDRKTADKHPDYKGRATIDGHRAPVDDDDIPF